MKVIGHDICAPLRQQFNTFINIILHLHALAICMPALSYTAHARTHMHACTHTRMHAHTNTQQYRYGGDVVAPHPDPANNADHDGQVCLFAGYNKCKTIAGAMLQTASASSSSLARYLAILFFIFSILWQMHQDPQFFGVWC